MIHQLHLGDCREHLRGLSFAAGNPPNVACIFADPPDNIGNTYECSSDAMPDADYITWLRACLLEFAQHAPIVWLSFNSRWTFEVGKLFAEFLATHPEWEGKPCVQVFTFGQHRQTDLGNNHRPLWRLKRKVAPLYPDQIRVPSWRALHGDKRADPRGRVPGDVFDNQYPDAGDVFDFPRVTGNSKQRCDWHPTQLHEELVERCIKLSTKPGETVLDPFGGTGTTMRVCRRINRASILIDSDPAYCANIAAAQNLSGSIPHWNIDDAVSLESVVSGIVPPISRDQEAADVSV